MRGKTIVATFRGQREARTGSVTQYDYGQVLVFQDVTLPATFEVYFGASMNGQAQKMIGHDNEVRVPDTIVESPGVKYAWVFLHEGADDGETEYIVMFNVGPRGKDSGTEPTPVQQDIITEAIAALNAGVEEVEGIADAIPQNVEDALAAAKESGEFDGPPGEPGPAGADGQPGPAGRDGVSPTASVTQTADGAVLTVTDGSGTTTATLSNGADGAPGADGHDGVSPTISASEITGGHRLTIVDASGTTTVDVMDGTDGSDGNDGADGVTFTPSVSAQGVISWSNDGGRQNPESVSIMGPQGPSGEAVEETVTGTTPSITAVANHRYVCGQVSTLSFTPSATGICDVVFESGSTATVLTVPSSVRWPDWFDPDNLEANAVYEINVLNGVYGAVMLWT